MLRMNEELRLVCQTKGELARETAHFDAVKSFLSIAIKISKSWSAR